MWMTLQNLWKTLTLLMSIGVVFVNVTLPITAHAFLILPIDINNTEVTQSRVSCSTDFKMRLIVWIIGRYVASVMTLVNLWSAIL